MDDPGIAMKPCLMMLVALLAGTALGTAVSVAILGGSDYGGSGWTMFVDSLGLSPVLMSVGLRVSLGVLGLPFFLILSVGAIASALSLALGIRKRAPRPQWLMFAGTFLWSLGNATALETMMGV